MDTSREERVEDATASIIQAAMRDPKRRAAVVDSATEADDLVDTLAPILAMVLDPDSTERAIYAQLLEMVYAAAYRLADREVPASDYQEWCERGRMEVRA